MPLYHIPLYPYTPIPLYPYIPFLQADLELVNSMKVTPNLFKASNNRINNRINTETDGIADIGGGDDGINYSSDKRFGNNRRIRFDRFAIENGEGDGDGDGDGGDGIDDNYARRVGNHSRSGSGGGGLASFIMHKARRLIGLSREG